MVMTPRPPMSTMQEVENGPKALTFCIGHSAGILHDAITHDQYTVVVGGYNDEEPLSSDSPLWFHDKVIVTPHISGLTRDYMRKVCNVFAENWELWNEGKVLGRKVDRSSGY